MAKNNNNPFNIRRTSDRWQGQINYKSTDSFVKFRSIEYGIRAGINLLRTYLIKGYDTIDRIIPRYAPPSENPTMSYIDYVESVVHIPRDQKISLSSLQFYNLCKAICWFESKYELDYDLYISICTRFHIL